MIGEQKDVQNNKEQATIESIITNGKTPVMVIRKRLTLSRWLLKGLHHCRIEKQQ